MLCKYRFSPLDACLGLMQNCCTEACNLHEVPFKFGLPVQEPEVWHLLKDLETAAKEHNTGSVLLICCQPL